MNEFIVNTDRGSMRIAAKTQEEAEQLAKDDGYRVMKEEGSNYWRDDNFVGGGQNFYED